ncbi:MAG: histidinol-phosphate transaminase [Bacteroidales bacterium]|nr:histidinol-phosphate transaminase [Bacteroidales bacterium]
MADSTFTLSEILRNNIKNITPYSTARDDFKGVALVNLDANENSFGSVGNGNYNRYPDPYQYELKQVVSKIKGMPIEQIFLGGSGSDEGIGLLYTAFCEPGVDNAIVCPPTYGMYGVSAEINNIKCKEVPLTEDFQLQADNVIAAMDDHTKLTWICSPNNPSGNLYDREAIRKVIEAAKGIVVIDEAYIDFCPEYSWLPELDKYPNLVILQTFSKAWGLANCRLGMMFASKEIIAVINKIKLPYNMNGMTQAYACKILSECAIQKDVMVEEILVARVKLISDLQQLPIIKKIYPSDANFLLVKMDNAHEAYNYLVKEGIIVRDRTKVQLCDDCLRITVGTVKENELLVEKLKQF